MVEQDATRASVSGLASTLLKARQPVHPIVATTPSRTIHLVDVAALADDVSGFSCQPSEEASKLPLTAAPEMCPRFQEVATKVTKKVPNSPLCRITPVAQVPGDHPAVEVIWSEVGTKPSSAADSAVGAASAEEPSPCPLPMNTSLALQPDAAGEEDAPLVTFAFDGLCALLEVVSCAADNGFALPVTVATDGSTFVGERLLPNLLTPEEEEDVGCPRLSRQRLCSGRRGAIRGNGCPRSHRWSLVEPPPTNCLAPVSSLFSVRRVLRLCSPLPHRRSHC